MQLAFTSRIRTYHSWQNADQDVKRAKQNHERGRVQGRANSQSLSVIAEVRIYPCSTF
jgi:sorting nexin-1/2